MNLFITNSKGTFDVSGLLTKARWAGDYRQAARSLDFSLVQSASDASVPVVDCPVGAAVCMTEDGETLFDGFVITRSAGTEGGVIDLECFDRGFYLKRNYGLYKFTGAPPQEIARRVCADFGLEIGAVAEVDLPISRLFATGNDTLYDILATAYTLASQNTGQPYHIGFRGSKLYITPREAGASSLVIEGGANLIAASTTESIKDLVSAVSVYDENDEPVLALEDAERLRLYGRLQEIFKGSAADDRTAAARRRLEDGGVSQTITVDCLGDVSSVTGGTVVVREPHTGLRGLFYIDSDTHEWKRGQYYNKLVLNFRNIMDEKEGGSLPDGDV